MKSIHPVIAWGILLALLTACSGGTKEEKRVQSVNIDTVRPASGLATVQFPGKVKAAQDLNLSFKVSGTIQKIYVPEGGAIRTGQLLAELDPTDYQVQLDATEAEYNQIKAEAERVMALYKENGTTPNANDKAVYGLKQITAKYQHHKDQLRYTRLYAPFGGYVQKHLFDAHETVGAGMPVLSVISAGTPEVEISLPASEYIRRGEFSSYHCTFDIYPGRQYALKLISVTPAANANQLYTMRLQLQAGDGQPLPSPGMNTMVTIHCQTEGAQALSVPSGAILEREGKSYVYLLQESDNRLRLCEVTPLQLLGNGRALVRSAEVKAGDVIVVSGTHHVREGEEVKPLPAVTPTNVGGLL